MIPVRQFAYLGMRIVMWATWKQRERKAIEPPPEPAPLESVLADTRALQQGLRRTLLEPAEATPPGEPGDRFRVLSEDLEHSTLGRDPRALHYLRKLGAALPPEPGSPLDPEQRRRLHAAHEASLDLLEFLQAELGRGSLGALAELRIDALPPPADPLAPPPPDGPPEA